jgi:hypothetical protein
MAEDAIEIAPIPGGDPLVGECLRIDIPAHLLSEDSRQSGGLSRPVPGYGAGHSAAMPMASTAVLAERRSRRRLYAEFALARHGWRWRQPIGPVVRLPPGWTDCIGPGATIDPPPAGVIGAPADIGSRLVETVRPLFVTLTVR